MAVRHAADAPTIDARALDAIADILADPQRAVEMLEDIAHLVTDTGRSLENRGGGPTWDPH